MEQLKLTGNFPADRAALNGLLRIGISFDVIEKKMDIAGRQASLYLVDGFAKDEVMEKIMEFLLSAQDKEISALSDAAAFSARFIPYVESDQLEDCDKIVTAVLSGTLCLLLEGFSKAIMIDARTYPARGVQEPDDDRVLRGSRDGFVETLIFNTALIRRRIRDPRLTMDIQQIGTDSKTDVVLCWLDGVADPKTVSVLKKKLKEIRVGSLTMCQESLAECLIRPRWYSPFPKVRYTERPDAAAAGILEGTVAILVDNSPSVMLLPTSVFDFLQDTNDYYFPPLIGSYLRLIRIAVFFLTIFLTPVWYLLISNPGWIPPWLSFIQIEEGNGVSVLAQLLIIEFIIDGLKLASLNTPSVLSSSFSVVGALVLGDFAVQAKWFVPEVVLFMAFVAIANFTQPSFELGYAFKLYRVFLLVVTALFGLWGFLGGVAVMVAVLALNRTVTGRSYLYPLIPFDGRALSRLLLRKRIHSGTATHK